MTSITSFIEQICNNKTNTKPLNYALVIDTSGSTDSYFVTGMKVLEKETSIISEFMLANPDNLYTLFSFNTTAKIHNVSILKEEQFVNMPNFIANGGTFTHTALELINREKVKYDVILLLTDGETNSSKDKLLNEMKIIVNNKTKLEIIAVSTSNFDMNTISQAEESTIPGMDLINMLVNDISKLTIYNKFHKDIPYEGATTSSIDKNKITFMGYTVDDFVPKFIDKLLNMLQNNKNSGVEYD